MSKSEPIEIEIDEEMLAKFEALPEGGIGRNGYNWTAEEDALLLRYWPIKRKMNVARLLGPNETTCRERYRWLTRETGEQS